MSTDAVCLADVAVRPVSDLIHRILAMCSPRQVLNPVVRPDAIEVPALSSFGWITSERHQDESMNQSLRVLPAAADFHYRVSAGVVKPLGDDPAALTHPA